MGRPVYHFRAVGSLVLALGAFLPFESKAQAPTPLTPLDTALGVVMCKERPIGAKEAEVSISVSIEMIELDRRQRRFEASYDSLGTPILLTLAMGDTTGKLEGQILVVAFEFPVLGGGRTTAHGVRYIVDSSSMAAIRDGRREGPVEEKLDTEMVERARTFATWLWSRGCHSRRPQKPK
jgi:hypothetical protein